MSILVLLLFLCSGATALIYEVAWSKHLSLIFGSTVQGQTVVLAVFMGGLALGNRLFGAWADRLRHPLVAYGWLEVAIGLYAFAFRWISQWADEIFLQLGPGLLEHSGSLLLFKGLLSAALLLGPATCMGGTLPIIAAWLQRSATDAGRRSARFYSVNTLGAVCGAALAGFFLISTCGLKVTLEVTGLANVLVGLGAMVAARWEQIRSAGFGFGAKPGITAGEEPGRRPAQGEAGRSAAAAVTAPGDGMRGLHPLRLACAVVALTGAVSMGLEVAAARALGLVFGASLPAFAVVLIAFILGIGLGSAAVASPRFRWSQHPNLPAICLLLAGAVILVLIGSIEKGVFLYTLVRSGLAPTDVGYAFQQLLTTAVSVVVLGTPAALLGAVLPVCIRALSHSGDPLGRQVGCLLTWNTLGAVAGVLLTGFVLMPWVGLRGTFAILALVLCLAATGWAFLNGSRRLILAGTGLAALTIVVSMIGGENWRQVLGSGIFRQGGMIFDSRALAQRRELWSIPFYQDGADATVSVEQRRGDESILSLRINGKVDASSKGDIATQYLLGHLPLLMRPESTDVFVLGLGSGMTAGAVLAHPVERLVVAENCAPVLKAAEWFAPWNRGVLSHPRARIYVEDARAVLKLSPRSYDVIISEPSNPWMAGVGSVFSLDFYEIAARRLKPGGLMVQWFHLYEMNDQIVEMVLRTFRAKFPFMEIWDCGVGDIILVGSEQPWRSDAGVYARAMERPEVRQDLASIGLESGASVWARQLASQRTAFAIADAGAIQTDTLPLLEYQAPKAFYKGRGSQLLFRFDERTWQTAMAPPEKRRALAGLEEADLQAIFGRFSSMNSELASYFKARFERADGAALMHLGVKPLPLIFPVSTLTGPAVPPSASPIYKALLETEWSLISQRASAREALSRVEALLDEFTPEADLANWKPDHFVALTVRGWLAEGDLVRARAALKRSGRLGRSHEIRYLTRILDHEENGQSTLAQAPLTGP